MLWNMLKNIIKLFYEWNIGNPWLNYYDEGKGQNCVNSFQKLHFFVSKFQGSASTKNLNSII